MKLLVRLILEILFVLASTLVTNDALKRVPALCQKIIRFAASLHGEGSERKRFYKEYLADFEMHSANKSELQQLLWSFQTINAALKNTSTKKEILRKAMYVLALATLIPSGITFILGRLEIISARNSGTGLLFMCFAMLLLVGIAIMDIEDYLNYQKNPKLSTDTKQKYNFLVLATTSRIVGLLSLLVGSSLFARAMVTHDSLPEIIPMTLTAPIFLSMIFMGINTGIIIGLMWKKRRA